MKQSELIALIERTAPLAIAAPWDKSGVQVASARQDINRLAVCLDPTPESIRIALSGGAEMILAHHPLTMEGRFTDRLDSYHEVLSLVFRADVPLYSAHTSLDANPLGPVSWLADELGLCRIPSSDTKDGEAGHGMPLPLTVLEQHRDHQPLSCQFALTSDLNRTLMQEENGVLWFEQDEPVNNSQSEVRFDRIWTLQTRTYEIQISASDFLIERIQPTVEKTFRHLIETQTK